MSLSQEYCASTSLKETDRLMEELSGRVKLTFFSLDTFLRTTVVFWIQLFDV